MDSAKSIIDLARASGFECDPNGHIFADDPDGVCGEELKRFATLHRAQVLDEAARACKDVSSNSGSEQYNIFGKDLAEQCAGRVLKGKNNE